MNYRFNPGYVTPGINYGFGILQFFRNCLRAQIEQMSLEFFQLALNLIQTHLTVLLGFHLKVLSYRVPILSRRNLQRMSSLNKPAPDRHFMSDPDQRLLCHVFVYTTDLKANLAGPDPGDPERGLTLTFAHSRLQRLGTHRLMRKQPNINFALTMQKMSRSNSAGFNALGAYPTGFQGL
jgi:hypothetical protein